MQTADGDKAYDRIKSAFDPACVGALTERLASLLRNHFQEVENRQGRVLNWQEPSGKVSLAHQELAQGDAAPVGAGNLRDVCGRFEELVRKCLAHGNNLHHPRYIGHQVPAPVPIAGIFDAVGSITNQVMAIYEMGPFATAVECALIETFGSVLGFTPGAAGGVITSGGSLGNLTGLLAARNISLGDVWRAGLARQEVPPVLVTHADAHYSVARSAGILGLGTDQIVPTRLDSRRRMDAQQLNELLGNLRARRVPIVGVVACACATPIGAFDPLPEIAEVCRRHEVWLHVDAAHGGAAALSERHRHLVAGLHEADSVVCDAHKMLFVPALCAFLFYKDRAHRFAAFEQTAPYLFDPSAPGMAEYDSGLATVECTKRAAAFGLWGVWSMFGRQLFRDMVDRTFALGRQFYEMLEEAGDFEPLHEPQCNIVAFRHIPGKHRDADERSLDELQLRLRRSIIESGEFYIVPCRIDGRSALRVTIINPLTTADDLRELLSAVRRHGEKLLANP